MKLAILGTRGVPPRYGGFETMAGELSMRLAQRGHDVTVYCREMDLGDAAAEIDADGRWRGVHRIVLPAAGHKYLETVSHTFLSAVDAVRRGFDAVLLCNAANAFVLPILLGARIPVAINVDGIERKRRKWNVLGRAVYATGEAFSASLATAVIADADVIADYYRSTYSLSPEIIPYGSEFPAEPESDVLERLNLRSRNYILYVSRFEPENNPLEVVLAYEKLLAIEPDLPPLVMVGKGLYAHQLVAELSRHASGKVLLPGGLYGAGYRTLQRHALVYIQATEVGGTHPAMIEAMASGGAVLAHDTPENREVGGNAVGFFQLRPLETLSHVLQEWLTNEEVREDFRGRGRARAAARYGWDQVTDAYERLFQRIHR